MIALRRIARVVALLGAVTLGVTGCQPAANDEKPAAADVAHDHDGDGVADHAPDEHDADIGGGVE